jgi:hypothetical protein
LKGNSVHLAALAVRCNVRSEPKQLLKKGFFLVSQTHLILLVFVNEIIAENLADHSINIPLLNHATANLRLTCYVRQYPETLGLLEVCKLDGCVTNKKAKKLHDKTFIGLEIICDLIVL